MPNISPSERIAGDLAAFLGPNHIDYPPISEMTTEYIHRFGTVKLGDIAELAWVKFLADCQARRYQA